MFTVQGLVALVLGVAIGLVMGAIPGLTGTMAIALLIPLTYFLPPIIVMPALVGMYKGSICGGSIPAILINTPGTPAAAATALDGYALTKQGKSGKALRMALYSSFCGDTFSDLVLIMVAAPLAALALKFGPTELAALIVFSLMMVAVIATMGSPIKGLISGAAGFLLGMIGLDPINATSRLEFGMVELSGGLELMPFLIGLLALSEVFMQMGKSADMSRLITNADVGKSNRREDNRVLWKEFKGCIKTILRSSCIGTFLGALPGLGPTVAAYLGYGEAMRNSKRPEEFGKGSLEGVAACEAANNAVCGANLIPLVTLGIPGDLNAAVLLGAFMVHGMQPGPLMMRDQAPLLYGLFLGLLAANVIYLVLGSLFIKGAAKIAFLPVKYIMPAVAVLCLVGAYANSFSIFDVWVAVVFGVVGYLMNKLGFSPPAMLIAFILAPMLENHARTALLIHEGQWSIFLTKPISLAFLLITVLIMISVFMRQRKRSRQLQEGHVSG
ncbi:MAG: tripartite tricarboxylate transporter permease [Bacillota bacterium]|jgi:putative tricarboxylic transport membrane protein